VPEEKGRRLLPAVGTGLTLAAAVLASALIHPLALFGLVFLLLVLATLELYSALERGGRTPARIPGVLATAGAFLASHRFGPEGLLFGLALGSVLVFAWTLLLPPAGRSLQGLLATLLGPWYLGFFGGFVALILREDWGLGAFLGFVGLTALYDVGAFAVGRTLGRRPLAPTVSPAKTWEGAVGGSLVALVLAAALGPYLPPFTRSLALGLAGLVCLLAPLGDLAESFLKRELGLKDMGSILPGHGGILDRVDAVLFVAPAAYYLLLLFLSR
jgi:phosphatidate cytidylyltransferase